MVNEPSLTTDLQLKISDRQILKMALPISLAMLVPQVNYITNNIFISEIGETELATAGITGVYYLVFALVGNGLNSAVQGLMARRAGENRPEEIGKIFSQAQWIALFFAGIGIMATWLFVPSFISLGLESVSVQNNFVDFLRIRIWGLPFLYLFQTGNAFLVATNNSRYMKYGFAALAAVNILLDYLLIYGKFGFPELGFNGAALASVIAEIIAVSFVFAIILYKRFHFRFSLFNHLHYNPSLAALLLRQSLPLVAQWLLSTGAWLLFYILIEHMGERELAISNTMRNIFGLIGIFIWGFASTSNAMVSNIIGQGQKDKVIFLIKKIMLHSLGFTFFLCLLINLFPETFVSIYGRENAFVEEAIPVIRMVTVGILAMSIATVWLNAVTGTGNTRINLLIEIIAIFIYGIYVWIVVKGWELSLVWAWASEFVYWMTLFIFSFFYLRSGKWKKINIIERL